MTKNAKNYRRQILSLTIATVFILGIVAISNTDTVTAEEHPITPTGEKIEPYEGYVGQVVPTAVNCNVDSNVVAWVTNNGGTVGDYLTIADDIENNLGVTARNVQLAGSVPDCIVKLVISHAPAACHPASIGAANMVAVENWVRNDGGELLILEEFGGCGGGSAPLTAAFGAIYQSNTATTCGFPGENYDATEFDASHPIMAGVTSFNMQCGTDFVSDGTLATVVLDSTNNRPVFLAGPVDSGCVVITGDSNWLGAPGNAININDNRLAANNVFAFLNECTSDPLEEILKEIKEIWMAIQDEVIPLLRGIDAKLNAQTDKVSVTVNLDDIKLKTGEVMVLLDTTGTGKLSTVHVAANLPCNSLGDGKPTAGGGNDDPSIWIVAGVAGGGLSGVINDATDDTGFVGPENTCVFHDTIDAADVDGGMITDVIIIHPDNHPDADKKEIKKHEKLKGVVVTVTGTYE